MRSTSTLPVFLMLVVSAALAWRLDPHQAETSLHEKPMKKVVTIEPETQESAGALRIIDRSSGVALFCPLRHTDVVAEISAYVADVIVTQQFENPYAEPIEAIYTFPLSATAAIHDMTLHTGSRTIRAKIMDREKARQLYENARRDGHLTGLLNQERPNIFTQYVANIQPRERIDVVIRYSELVHHRAGVYEFVFPMTVGPRYIPGTPTGRQGTGWSPDTDVVPDASIITPHAASSESRSGHDISIRVNLDAALPLSRIWSALHSIETESTGGKFAVVKLAELTTIPNKDFILKYEVGSDDIQNALLTHVENGTGYFALLLQPPKMVTPQDVRPKELVFVLDTSGSMMGYPIEKAKETVRMALSGLYPMDTFNLITFSGDTRILFPEPVRALPENLRTALDFLESTHGSGGTEMMTAIRAALDPSDALDHVRIVCFLTDGFVGNDMAILDEIQKHPNARVFSFGIGDSANRFLLDGMASLGRGEAEYVTLADHAGEAASKFYERIRNPVLTDITVDWEGLPVADIYPKRIPDLFDAQPIIIYGRYSQRTSGDIQVRGNTAYGPWSKKVRLDFDGKKSRPVLGKLWARKKIDDLMASDFAGIQSQNPKDEIREAIIHLGLQFRLITQFTSFVAVEERNIGSKGQPKRVEIPVELPEGTSHEGFENAIFGEAQGGGGLGGVPGGVYGGVPGGIIGGVEGGMIGGTSGPAPLRVSSEMKQPDLIHRVEPEYPEIARKARIQGVVILEAVIDEKGNVQDVKVLRAVHPILDQQAIVAVRKWKYRPAKLNNNPVKVYYTIAVRYKCP